MSTLTLDAIAGAGLAEIAFARSSGDLERVRSLASQLDSADLLALGALADQVRVAEVGDVVRIYTNVEPDSGDDVVDMHQGAKSNVNAPLGIDFLRAVAIARITGPRAARVRVDWSKVGLEIAQVALGFGASELFGAIASKRGLPIADDAERKIKGEGMVSFQAIKQRELVGQIRVAGRKPVVIGPRGVVIDDSDDEGRVGLMESDNA